MSHKASAWAMDQRVKTPLGKLVLLVLADCHNGETGLCFPSIPYLSDKAGCSRQGVKNVLADLRDQGLISSDRAAGQKTFYYFGFDHTDRAKECPGTKSVPANLFTQVPTLLPEGGHSVAKGGHTLAPNQEVTGKITRKVNREYKPTPKLPRPDSVSEQIWTDFQTLRKTLKAPITETAINGIDREASKAGLSLNAALQICVERSWRSFKAEWLQNGLNIPQAGNGKYTARTIQNAHNLRGWADEQP